MLYVGLSNLDIRDAVIGLDVLVHPDDVQSRFSTGSKQQVAVSIQFASCLLSSTCRIHSHLVQSYSGAHATSLQCTHTTPLGIIGWLHCKVIWYMLPLLSYSNAEVVQLCISAGVYPTEHCCQAALASKSCVTTGLLE